MAAYGFGILGAWALLVLGLVIGFGLGRYTEFKPWENKW